MAKKTAKSKAVETRKPEERGLDTAATLYANSVNIGASPWDLRFRFGQIEEADDTHLVIRQLATVYMSPQHAKAFAALLNQKIAEFETAMPNHWKFGDGQKS